jgi:hypothetical protein
MRHSSRLREKVLFEVLQVGLSNLLQKERQAMLPKIHTSLTALLVTGASIAIILTSTIIGQQAWAQSNSGDNLPRGRTATAIVDGQYPASYFPNTELLGADEMRIIALGTGMPNQTRAAVSISYLVELGNGDKFLFA